MRSVTLSLFTLIACGSSPSPQVSTPEPEPIVAEVPAEVVAPRFSAPALEMDQGCVVDRGTPICWGSVLEDDGPRRIDELSNIRKVALGGLTACALSEAGTLKCFGAYNEESRREAIDAELDDLSARADRALTDEEQEAFQEQMEAIERRVIPATVARNVHDVVVYDDGGCYITERRAVLCWTEGETEAAPPSQRIESEAQVVQLTSSMTHRCALQSDGRVQCWGEGDGLGWFDPDEEADIGFVSSSDVAEVAAGEDFTCARRNDGKVSCWGVILDELGIEPPDDVDELLYPPMEIAGIDDAVKIVAGSSHACALREGGRVTCWGDNRNGALGNGGVSVTRTLVDVTALSNAREITAGTDATCALVGEELRCVGSNRYGAFGSLPRNDEVVLFPARGTRLLTPNFRTCVERDGELVCTGNDLGASIEDNMRLRPFDDQGRNIDEIAAYIGYQCVRRGAQAECGRTRGPRRVLDGVSQVAVGTTSACALMRDRRVQCWQIRPGQTQRTDLLNRNGEPTFIPGVRRAQSISVGDGHACAVRTDGKVTCWGDNSTGRIQLPAGELGTAVELADVSDAVQVVVAASSTCVRKRDQSVACRTTRDWHLVAVDDVVDARTRGTELVMLTADHRVFRRRSVLDPVQVELPGEIVEISVGTSHSCARARDGRVWCWGIGSKGELGALPSWIHLEPFVVPLE